MARAKQAKKPANSTRGATKASRSAFRAKKTAKAARGAKIAEIAKTAKTAESDQSYQQLGVVTAPSGKLAVFDIGLIGYLPREALEPMLVTIAAPANRKLSVIGTRVGQGRFADCWDYVAVRVGEGETASSRKLGKAAVDFARLVFIDYGAIDRWQHEDSLDGLADFMFWGRDAVHLATSMHAPRTKEGFGWRNLSVAEAEAKSDQAARLKAADRLLLATDLRPHSHHFHALAAARKSAQGAGTIDVGDARACLFFTSWGDGVFPVYLDAGHDGQAVQLRVQLASPSSTGE